MKSHSLAENANDYPGVRHIERKHRPCGQELDSYTIGRPPAQMVAPFTVRISTRGALFRKVAQDSAAMHSLSATGTEKVLDGWAKVV